MHVSARLPFAQRYEGYIEQCRPYLGFLSPCSYWRAVTARPHIVLHLKRQSINATCYLGSMESLSEAQTRNEGGCGFKNLGSRSGPSRCPCWVSVWDSLTRHPDILASQNLLVSITQCWCQLFWLARDLPYLSRPEWLVRDKQKHFQIVGEAVWLCLDQGICRSSAELVPAELAWKRNRLWRI